MISTAALSTLILVALVVASATPLILIGLLIKDWIDGRLW